MKITHLKSTNVLKLLTVYFLICCSLPLQGIYQQISDENLKAFTFSCGFSKSWNLYSEFLKWMFEKQKELEPLEKRKLVYTLYKSYETSFPEADGGAQGAQTLDFTTWQDLNLLCGPKSNNAFNMLNKLDRASTELGKCMLARMLVDPLSDQTKLRGRQAIVRELITNNELFDHIDGMLKNFKNSENLTYTFWLESDAFWEGIKRKVYVNPASPQMLTVINNNTVISEARDISEQLSQAVNLGVQTAGAVTFALSGLLMLSSKFSPKADVLKKFAQEKLGLTNLAGLFTVSGLTFMAFNKIAQYRATKALQDSAVGAGYGIGLYYAFDNLRASSIMIDCVHAKVKALAECFTLLKECHQLIEHNEVLKKELTKHVHIKEIFEDLPKKSAHFKQLVQLLQNDSIRGSSRFLRGGRSLTAFKLMQELKSYVVPALIALGEIDAYMSIARLYKEGQAESTDVNAQKNKWCFAQYDENPSSPFIELNNFWNPFIDREKAIANSLSIGTDSPRSIIITGPNAGGKSTTMRGIVLSLLLAQSFGIAPAETMVFTPFTKIMTYLNITDDIAAGNSHFKAGVLRAQELLTMTSALQEQQYAFVALDEVFNGTTHEEGQAAAYSLIEQFGKNKKVMCATATHFPLITALGTAPLSSENTNSLFKNYKVTVSYDANGHIVYPFKLEEGVSQQSVALDILKEEGFKTDFLDRAKDLLA